MSITPVAKSVQGIRECVYPKNPESSKLRETYNRLRKAAIGISISRGIYHSKLSKAKAENDQFRLRIEQMVAEETLSKQRIANLLREMQEMGKVFEALESAGDNLTGEMDEYDNPSKPVDIYRGKPIFGILRAARRFRQAWLYAKEVNDIEIRESDDKD